MPNRVTAWLFTITLAVTGSQLAHAAAYRLAVPDATERHGLLLATGHAYLAYWPLAVAIGSVFGAFALATDLRMRLSGRPGSPLRPAHFAAVAPLAFVCQELLERGARTGAFPLEAFGDRTFALGIALQAPFALIAYVVARLLLRASAFLASRLSRAGTVRHRRAAISAPRGIRFPLDVSLALGLGSRGPPPPA